MIRKLIIAGLIALLSWSNVARADLLLLGVTRPAVAAGGYTGPGDVVSGWSTFWGTRGFSGAYAAPGTNKALTVRRASDNATQDVVILSNGDIDVASANSFAGTAATCTATAAGTTALTIASCSAGTVTINSTITGAGIVQPAYITAIGTCGAGAGTCTMNQAQTVTAATLTFQVALWVTQYYDQAGGSRTVLQSTAANQAQFFPSCVNGKACTGGNGAGSTSGSYITSGTFAGTNPVSFSTVIQYNSWATAKVQVGQNNNSGTGNRLASVAGPLFRLAGGTSGAIDTTLTTGVMHAYLGVANGASSSIYDNGTTTTGTVSASTTTTFSTYGSNTANSVYMFTGGFANSTAWSAGNLTTGCQNDQAYYGSGNFGAAC